jgi:hypothetical protein
LDTWLRKEKYNIPAGAEPMMKPYIESGMFFFVAKVNLKKVKREEWPRGALAFALSTTTPTPFSCPCAWDY